MIQYLRPALFRTVLAAALMFSFMQVGISCKDEAQPAPVQEQAAKESMDSAAKIGGESASSDLVYVITLHGTVGIIPGESAKAFTAEGLKVSLDAAKRAKATVVVLDIDGPGGQVVEMQNMVKVLLEAQVGGMRIVALPRDAFSAWSILALSCKEILVTPTSRMGAAVSITSNGKGFIEAVEGKDAVSQKFAAPFQALWRQITDVTGRPPCIADAMRIQTAELWYSPTKGFAEKSGTETDWQQLDDGVHVLCLTGTEMLKTKMATGEVRNQSDLPKLLNCAAGTQIKMNFPPEATQIDKNILPANLYEEVLQVMQVELEKTWAICEGNTALIEFKKFNKSELNLRVSGVMNWSDGISRNEITSFGSVFEFNVPGIWTTNSRESELIQITDIKCEFSLRQLSSADILNKVEWHGHVEFTAKTQRIWKKEEERRKKEDAEDAEDAIGRAVREVIQRRDGVSDLTTRKEKGNGVPDLTTRTGWSPWRDLSHRDIGDCNVFFQCLLEKRNGEWYESPGVNEKLKIVNKNLYEQLKELAKKYPSPAGSFLDENSKDCGFQLDSRSFAPDCESIPSP